MPPTRTHVGGLTAAGDAKDAADPYADPPRRILDYALRAECTHLGCLVEPDALGNGFSCPCHGSQYAASGTVKRGPAPKALGLAKVTEREDGVLVMSAYEGADFRQEPV